MNADSGVDEHTNADNNAYQTSIAITAFCQVLLFVQLVGVAASVDVLMLRTAMTKWRPILLGLAIQYILLTPIGAITSVVYGLPSPFDVALMSTMAMPGGIYSAWWCSLLNADVAVSIALSAWHTLLSVVAVPINLTIYIRVMKGHGTSWGSISWLYLLSGMVISYSALLFGTLLSWRYPWRRKCFYNVGNLCGYTLFFVGCVLSWSEGGEPVWNKPWTLYPAILTSCLVSMCIALALTLGTIKCTTRYPCLASISAKRVVAKVPKRLLRWSFFGPSEAVEWEGVERQQHAEAVAVTVSSLYQNTGLAISFVLGTFEVHQREDAASVPVLYGISQAVVLPIFLCAAWKMGWLYAPPDTPFFATMLNDFQPRRGSDRVETFRSMRNLAVLSKDSDDNAVLCTTPSQSPVGKVPVVLPWTRRSGVTPWQRGASAASLGGSSDSEAGLSDASPWDHLRPEERLSRRNMLRAFFCEGIPDERLDAALEKHNGHAGKAKAQLQAEEGALLLGDWCWEGGGALTIERRARGRVFHVPRCRSHLGTDLIAGDLRLEKEWWLVDLSPAASSNGSSESLPLPPEAIPEPTIFSSLRLQHCAGVEPSSLLMTFRVAGTSEWGPPFRVHRVENLPGDNASPSL